MARLCSTLSTVAHRSPMLLAGSISGRSHSKWWWCHDISYPLLAAEHLLCKAPWSETPCWTTSAHSRTRSPLDSAWKPGFFLSTSVLSALETLWQLRYINSHLPLPLPSLVMTVMISIIISLGLSTCWSLTLYQLSCFIWFSLVQSSSSLVDYLFTSLWCRKCTVCVAFLLCSFYVLHQRTIYTRTWGDSFWLNLTLKLWRSAYMWVMPHSHTLTRVCTEIWLWFSRVFQNKVTSLSRLLKAFCSSLW